MPWWRIRRRDAVRRPAEGSNAEERAEGTLVREAERRRLTRLLRRRDELVYDLERAEEASSPVNRWTERLEELNAAIAQAEADLDAVSRPVAPELPPSLPPLPVEIVDARPESPAQVSVRVGGETFAWREELDWSERGHQLAPPRLVLERGGLEGIVPMGLTATQRERLIERLAASLQQLAEDLIEAARSGGARPSLTLADLARPCPGCGGWQDLRGRCPECARLAWQRQQLQLDLRRLRKERDATLADLQRTRDRFPVLRRQLLEVENEIAALRAKGVETDERSGPAP